MTDMLRQITIDSLLRDAELAVRMCEKHRALAERIAGHSPDLAAFLLRLADIEHDAAKRDHEIVEALDRPIDIFHTRTINKNEGGLAANVNNQ